MFQDVYLKDFCFLVGLVYGCVLNLFDVLLTIFHNYRSSRDTSQGRKPANTTMEPVRINPILPPPPPSKFSTTDAGMVDYLSGDVYQSQRSSAASRSVPVAAPTHSNSKNSLAPSSPSESSSPPPDEFINPTATMFTAKPAFDEPASSSKSADSLPSSSKSAFD